MIKVVSFDVWNTLISPNPEFGQARNRFLGEALGRDIVQVGNVYKALKSALDEDAEQQGIGLSSVGVYNQFLKYTGREGMPIEPIRAGVEALFRAYPPTVQPGLREVLQVFQEANKDILLSIASNTNFVRGKVLSEAVLNQLGVEWAFKVFSDVIGAAKPSPVFWEKVSCDADSLAMAEPQEILHIGDNVICDGSAIQYGMHYRHVNGPKDIKRVLAEI
jgi:FMN phosphatase YigB (HAD superfamily)